MGARVRPSEHRPAACRPVGPDAPTPYAIRSRIRDIHPGVVGSAAARRIVLRISGSSTSARHQRPKPRRWFDSESRFGLELLVLLDPLGILSPRYSRYLARGSGAHARFCRRNPCLFTSFMSFRSWRRLWLNTAISGAFGQSRKQCEL